MKYLLLAALAMVFPGVAVGALFVISQCLPGHDPAFLTPAYNKLKFEDHRIKGPDAVTTTGWYIPPEKAPAPAVLILHGHFGRRDENLKQAAFLHRAGFGVALYDHRHHGDSEDALVTFGVREAGDARAWAQFLRDRPEHRGEAVGVLGYSMGAVTAIKLASIDPAVAAVVADSPFASLSEQARWRIAAYAPAPLVGYCTLFAVGAGYAATGLGPGAWNVPEWLAATAPRPVLLIHGRADTNIPCSSTERLVSAAQKNVEAWLVPGANHIESYRKETAAYEARVGEFFRRALAKPAR